MVVWSLAGYRGVGGVRTAEETELQVSQPEGLLEEFAPYPTHMIVGSQSILLRTTLSSRSHFLDVSHILSKYCQNTERPEMTDRRRRPEMTDRR